MRSFLFGLLIIVLSTSLYAQQSWQEAADAFIETQVSEDESYRGPETLEALRQHLADEFKTGQLDVHLAHLLAIWEIEDGEDATPYIDYVENAYPEGTLMRALFLLDVMRSSLEEFTRSEEILETLRALKLDSTQLYVRALTEIATHLSVQRKIGEADRYYEHALALMEKIGDKDDELYHEVLSNLSSYYLVVGRLAESVRYEALAEANLNAYHGVRQPYWQLFREEPVSLAILDEADPTYHDRCRIALLMRYTTPSGFGGPTSPYREMIASRVFEEIAAHPARGTHANVDAWVDAQRSTLALAHGNYELAATLLERVLEGTRGRTSAQELIQEISAQNKLACVYLKWGRYSDAERLFHEIHSLAGRYLSSLIDVTTKLRHNKTLSVIGTGDRDKLRSELDYLLNPANGVYIEVDHIERMELYGDVLFELGDFAAARTLYQLAYDEWWSAAQGEYEQRQQMDLMNGESVQLLDETNVSIWIGDSIAVNTIQDYKPSGAAYLELLPKLARAAFRSGALEEAETYTLAHINAYYGALDWSQAAIERGMNLYELHRLKEVLFPSYDLFLSLVMTDSLADAETNAERKRMSFAHVLDSKANLLLQYRHMRAAIENSADAELKTAFATYLAYRDSLVTLKVTNGDRELIEQLTVAINDLTADLANKTNFFEPVTNRFVFWHQVKAVLKNDEAAVEMKRFTTPEGEVVYAAYLVLADQSYPEIIFLKNGRFLEERGIRKYQNAIQARVEDLTNYDDFWRPIADAIGSQVKKVYFAPDGVYSQVNIHTLLNPDNRRYVIDDLTVYNMVSAKDLLKDRSEEVTIRDAVLMGRPAYYIDDKNYKGEFDPVGEDRARAITRRQIAAGEITDLAGTEAEVNAIAGMMKKAKVKVAVITGKRATEEAFRKSVADVIHVATHGFWFEEDVQMAELDAMLNSGLLFAGVKNFAEGQSIGADDGILTAYELQGMDLQRTKLAVLSACQTARGRVEAGEGVFGLQRALIIAGVDKVLMSLWNVDDTATKELFESFYRHWIDRGATIEESFFRAQAELKATYRDPYYWGAFVLVE